MEGLLPADLVAHGLGKSAGVIFVEDSWALTCVIGGPTVADGILDRLVHNAHRIEMRGHAMRKSRGKPNN